MDLENVSPEANQTVTLDTGRKTELIFGGRSFVAKTDIVSEGNSWVQSQRTGNRTRLVRIEKEDWGCCNTVIEPYAILGKRFVLIDMRGPPIWQGILLTELDGFSFTS